MSGNDPPPKLGYGFRLPDSGHWQSGIVDLQELFAPHFECQHTDKKRAVNSYQTTRSPVVNNRLPLIFLT